MLRFSPALKKFLFGKFNLPLLTLLLVCTFVASSGKTPLDVPPAQVISSLAKAAQVAQTLPVEKEALITVHFTGII